MIELLIKALMAYLLGSVSGSMVVGALRHVDIRESGSGNAGGTNAFRTQGFWFALGVVIIDIGKGVLAAWGLPAIGLGLSETQPGLLYQQLTCGFAAVVGAIRVLEDGTLEWVEPGPPMNERTGIRQDDDRIQLGLTNREIHSVWGRIESVVHDIQDGDITVF